MGNNQRLADKPEIFTIGHSTHPVERFIELLRGAGVDAVADVRRFPGSRRNPQYGAERLAAALGAAGVAYEPFGEALGGRRRMRPDSPNDAWRVAAFRGYADHMGTPEFARGMEGLEALARERRTAVMCAEWNWHRCHRRLVADALTARGWRVLHISPRGDAEQHQLPSFAVVADGKVSYASQPPIGDLSN